MMDVFSYLTVTSLVLLTFTMNVCDNKMQKFGYVV